MGSFASAPPGLHPGGGFSLHEELLRCLGALLRLLRGGCLLLHRRGWHLSAVRERRQDRASRRLHLPLDRPFRTSRDFPCFLPPAKQIAKAALGASAARAMTFA